MKKLCIVIPAYNEEKRIGGTLLNYLSFFDALKDKGILNYQILVVINNTQDKTEDVVKSYQKKNKNLAYLNLKRGGKGYAVMEGFKKAVESNFDLIGFVDADGSTPAKAFYYLVEKIDNYDGAIAGRCLRGSKVEPKQSFMRIVASRTFNFIVKILFLLPYGDTQCGAKLFKKAALERAIPRVGMTRWAFDVDLLYQMKKEGFRVAEVVTIWSDKEQSKLNLKKNSIQMFFAVVQLRIINSPFKRILSPLKFIRGFFWRLIK